MDEPLIIMPELEYILKVDKYKHLEMLEIGMGRAWWMYSKQSTRLVFSSTGAPDRAPKAMSVEHVFYESEIAVVRRVFIDEREYEVMYPLMGML
jgi:hypothetical protein